MAIFLAFLGLNTYAYAEDASIEPIGRYGHIDWVNQMVSAKGTGAPPAKYYGKPQARPMAIRAATADARRNLLEVIKGVHIDSVTTVKNELFKDDTIVTRVQGLIKSSTVDDIQYLSDGTVEAMVSMPLTGQLGQALLEPVAATFQRQRQAPSPKNLEQRLMHLENRVKALENRIARLKTVSRNQQETIQIFQQFIAAWIDYAANRPQIRAIGSVGDRDLSALQKELNAQAKRLSGLADRLDNVAQRLAALEGSPGAGAAIPPAAQSKAAVTYSGLVIDARQIGFRPCLKPEIFGQGQLIYPGDYVDFKTAVRNGYVRYYRKVDRAQQSGRAGSLPLTIKAQGTYQGKRGLEIKVPDYSTLKEITALPGNFMQQCRVVIVF